MGVLISIIVYASVIFLVAHTTNKTSALKYRDSRVVKNSQTPKPRESTVKPSIINSEEDQRLTWEDFTRINRELFADSYILGTSHLQMKK